MQMSQLDTYIYWSMRGMRKASDQIGVVVAWQEQMCSTYNDSAYTEKADILRTSDTSLVLHL